MQNSIKKLLPTFMQKGSLALSNTNMENIKEQ